jgi:hypothetical protein
MMQLRYSVSALLAVLFFLVACGSPAVEPQAETQVEFDPTAAPDLILEPTSPPTGKVTTQTHEATAAPTEAPTTKVTTQNQVTTVVQTKTPAATSIPESPIQTPREDKTGIPQVDLVIATILSNDLGERQALIRFVTAGCTKADGLVSRPRCENGQAAGTPIKYFPLGGPGEGHSVIASEVDRILEFEAEALYAAYVVSEDLPDSPEFPRGTYVLFFTISGSESDTESVLLRVNDEGYIVRLDGLGGMPLDFYFQQMAADLIEPPPETVIFGSEAAEILVYPRGMQPVEGKDG